MDPLKRTLKPTFWSEKYTRQFNPNNEYTHRFQSSVKGSKSIQLVDIGEKNTHYTLYKEAIKHLDKKINAIDVGCRDGEFTKYLTWSFDHVFCFDYRKRIQFPMNINTTKNQVTHYTCPIGKNLHIEHASGRGNLRSNKIDPRWIKRKPIKIFPLDYFQLKDINLIKIDVDGMDEDVVRGAEQTISCYNPVIIIEEIVADNGLPNHNGIEYIKSLGYKVAHLQCDSFPMHKDYILIPLKS